jgi:hypothetical protein
MEKLFFSLGLIITGLALGYIVQIMAAAGSLSLPVPVADLRKILQKTGLLFVMPALYVLVNLF